MSGLGARQALAITTTFWPDVAFVEVILPGLDGCELARRLRQVEKKQPLLVALTVNGTDKDRRLTREAGFDYHLVKPGDVVCFLELLGRSVLSRQDPEEETVA